MKKNTFPKELLLQNNQKNFSEKVHSDNVHYMSLILFRTETHTHVYVYAHVHTHANKS